MITKKDAITINDQETILPSVKNPHNDLFVPVFSRKDKTISFFKDIYQHQLYLPFI
jgi:hypothetical protein